MIEVKCKVGGCPTVLLVDEAAKSPRFICRNHRRSVQLKAVGRKRKRGDYKDTAVHFQKHQFDGEL